MRTSFVLLLLAVVLAGMSGVDESILYASCGEGQAHRAFGWYSALGTAGMLTASALYTLVIGPDYRMAALWTAAAPSAAAVMIWRSALARQSPAA